MKKRLYGKKAGIVILAVLIIISLVETIIRGVQSGYRFSATNGLGEPLAIAIFAAIILLFVAKKKDRICYICYGVLIGWFILEEAFGLVGLISTFFSTISNIEEIKTVTGGSTAIAILSIVVHLLTSICIVAIGALVVEYMNDGTIYNRAFNGFCIVAVVLLVITTIVNINGTVTVRDNSIVLLVLNNLYRITMIFLFTFFAYDSAKAQLKKVDFSK